jgi:hypothetical protein
VLVIQVLSNEGTQALRVLVRGCAQHRQDTPVNGLQLPGPISRWGRDGIEVLQILGDPSDQNGVVA